MEVEVIIDELPRDTAVKHRTKETIPLSPDKKFHIFFAYRDIERDKFWVKSVIDKFEKEYGYTCYDHERDFLPGTKVMDNIKDGVMNSEKVVVVFSKESIDSYYVSLEAEMAYQLSLEKRKNLLIPVLLDDCDVPEEYKLLTYIDAREGVEEITWWPKLMKSLESAKETSRPQYHVKKNSVAGNFKVLGDKTFAVYKICTMETKCNYIQCSMQGDSKYVPAEMRLDALGVPADIIRKAYKELLQSPRVLCRQKCWIAANIWTVLSFFGYFFPFGRFFQFVISCIDSPPCTIGVDFYFWIGFFILVPVCVFFGCKKYYLKAGIPSAIHFAYN
ncbi:hypothetical protein CHS0354_030141 [Potamilus streckersoni]|uniref:TIR domain-containing protein n=1 Tax=Potamilus streckersoni TaxID=2493646 RepID=A0AAE0ST81_9BIVA|nr:hypothetical protein CHS0354_030141 [Potamilus streckersoni]